MKGVLLGLIDSLPETWILQSSVGGVFRKATYASGLLIGFADGKGQNEGIIMSPPATLLSLVIVKHHHVL